MVLDALKKRLYKENDKHHGRWLKELPVVVWGRRTQPSCNTGVSPYFMVFGSEVVLPADIAFRSPRVENHDEKSYETRELEVNCAEEQRLDTCTCMAKYLEGLRRYYNRNVKDMFFVVGDLVLRRKQKTEGLHKLSLHWEGPYMVKAVTKPTSYRLCDLDGVDVPNSWHIDLLRHFYA
jgi:hypothetical protein